MNFGEAGADVVFLSEGDCDGSRMSIESLTDPSFDSAEAGDRWLSDS